MLASPWSSGVNICFRCELRLLRRSLAASKLYKTSPALLSTTAHAAQEPELRQKRRIRYDRTYSDDGKAIYKHIHPQGRIRGRRGKEVREEIAQLDIESLGEPSEIIVLKEADFDRDDFGEQPVRNQPYGHGKSKDEPGTSQDLLQSIEAEKSAPTQEAVNADIEALRAEVMQISDGQGQSLEFTESQLEHVRERLLKSYTRMQLHGYIKQLLKSQSSADSANEQPTVTSSVQRSPWVSGQGNLKRVLLADESSILEKSMNISKAFLVRLIFDRLWNISLAGQVGDIDLRMQTPAIAKVLAAGPQPTILDALGQQHAVSFSLSGRKLRIRGTARAASEAADSITVLVADMRSRQYDLSGMAGLITEKRSLYSDSSLQAFLTRILGHIRLAVDSETAGVGMMNDKTAAAPAHEPVVTLTALAEADLDVAQQVLLQFLDFPGAGDCSTTLTDFIETTPIAIDSNVRPNACGQLRYTRRVGGRPRKNNNALPGAALDSLMQSHQSTIKLPAENAESHSTNKLLDWSLTPRQSLTATLGLAGRPLPADSAQSNISPQPPATKDLPGPARASISPLKLNDVFVPLPVHVLPWLSKLEKSRSGINTGDDSAPGKRNELHFKFLPSPFQGGQHGNLARFPAVKLILADKDATGEYAFSHWQAQLCSAEVIVPLPHLSADLKFTKGGYLHSVDEGNDQLQACIREALQSVTSGGRIHAPAKIRMSTPHHTTQSSSKPLWNKPWARRDDWSFDGAIPSPDFLFAGVEYRQIVELQWKDPVGGFTDRLTYTAIEAGRVGGRRVEVTLHNSEDREVDISTLGPIKSRQEFYEAAFGLVRQITEAANGDAGQTPPRLS